MGEKIILLGRIFANKPISCPECQAKRCRENKTGVFIFSRSFLLDVTTSYIVLALSKTTVL